MTLIIANNKYIFADRAVRSGIYIEPDVCKIKKYKDGHFVATGGIVEGSYVFTKFKKFVETKKTYDELLLFFWDMKKEIPEDDRVDIVFSYKKKAYVVYWWGLEEIGKEYITLGSAQKAARTLIQSGINTDCVFRAIAQTQTDVSECFDSMNVY